MGLFTYRLAPPASPPSSWRVRTRQSGLIFASNYTYTTQGAIGGTSSYGSVPGFTKLAIGATVTGEIPLNRWDRRI